jgi:hypothetical protein
MTSDTRNLSTSPNPPPTERATPDKVQLNGVQVAASALASVSAAVVASLFGVAGTVVGAGLVAIISTTGSALYSSSMKRTSNQLRRAREQLLTARSADSRTGGNRAVRSSTAVLDRPEPPDRGYRREPVDTDDTPDTDPPELSRWRRGLLTVGSRRGLKWPALLGAAVLVFVIAIGVVTAFEAVTQKPISALTGHSSSSSTTIGSLTGGSSKATPTPAPSATSSGSGSDAGTTAPSAAPSQSVSPRSQSSASATPSTPKPAVSASVAPSIPAPQPSGGSANGKTQQVPVP